MRRKDNSMLNFVGQNLYIGIDVHLRSWSVAILSENATLKKFSQNADPIILANYLNNNYPGARYYSVYEAGFCGFWIHRKLTELGINNIIVNPADVPTMVKEKLRKTDAVDCVKLARGLRSGDLKSIFIPNNECLEIRSLIRLRNSIVKDTTREKNRIKALLYFYGIDIPEEFHNTTGPWPKRFLQWLREVDLSTEYGRKVLDMHIEQYCNLKGLLLQETRAIRKIYHDGEFSETLPLITSVPGVGLITGISFLSEICDIRRFKSSDQLAAYVGLIPMCHSSGEKECDGDITIRSHKALRCNIIESAWKAIKHDPALTLAYENYRKRMNANKAIVKIARKLINRIYFVLKYKQKYVQCVVE